METTCPLAQLPAHPPEEQRCAKLSISKKPRPRQMLLLTLLSYPPQSLLKQRQAISIAASSSPVKTLQNNPRTEQRHRTTWPSGRNCLCTRSRMGQPQIPGRAFTGELDTSETTPQQHAQDLVGLDMEHHHCSASFLLPGQLRLVLLPYQHGTSWGFHGICPMAGLLSDITCGQRLGYSEGLGRF